mmetsp:Transcript_10739/g.22348  ORF Transcript_10739/g.22348 Transcript_10739/m.22348 type:complete len:457 (-) Transcript_10739:426-1796(-)
MTIDTPVPAGWASLKELPVLGERQDVWQCYVHKLRTWTQSFTKTAEGESVLVRPYLILVVSVGNGMFLTTSSETATAEGATNILRQGEAPTTTQVLQFLQGVMSAPRVMNTSMEGAAPPTPARPAKITFCDTPTSALHYGENDKWSSVTACKYVPEGRALLQELGIQAIFAPVPQPLMQSIVRGQIEKNLAQVMSSEVGSGLNAMPGLSSFVNGFTDTFGESLFDTATTFHRAEVWKKIPPEERRPIKVSFVLATDAEGNRYRAQGYAALLGDLSAEDGDTFGLGLYKEEKLAWAAVQGVADDQEASIAGQSLLYFPPTEVPFEDLDDIERGDWKIPGTSQVPLFCKFEVDQEDAEAALFMTRPNLIDLMWFDLAMKAIIQLVEGGELTSAESKDLAVAQGPWTVRSTSCAAKGATEDIEIDVTCPVHASAAALTQALDNLSVGAGAAGPPDDGYL